MNDTEKRQLENQLLVMGLKSLADPELNQQFADLITRWPGDRHTFFQDMLNELDADKRYEAYCAIAPKLGFKALSFSDYECRIAEKAGRMVSHKLARAEGSAPRPINIGNQQFLETDQEQADAAIVKLCCQRCGKKSQFLGDTPAGAMMKAREKGWKRDLTIQKEFCPRCAKTLEERKVMMQAGNA